MLQAIIFDFDGVIVDSEPAHFAAFVEVFEPLGVTFDFDAYQREIIGFDDRDAMAYLFEHKLGQPDSDERRRQIADLCETKQQVYLRLVAQGQMQAIPGTLDFLDAVREQLPVAIASGATRADIDAVLTALGRADQFPVIVTTDDVEASKPHPASYAKAFDQLATITGRDLDPGHCLAIEDSVAGLESAKGAGLRTLALKTTHPTAQLSIADKVVDNLEGVSLDQVNAWFFST